MIFCLTVLVVAVYAFESRSMAAPAWSCEMYETEVLNTRQQGLDIRGEVPVILEDFGTAYEDLNQEIESAVDTLIEGARRIRARSITFDYEIESTNAVVSIVISATARAVTDRTFVLSVNSNPRTGALVTLAQAKPGLDIASLAEGRIAELLRQDPATYYAAFNAPPTGQAFYLTDTTLVLLFDEFQLSSVPGGTSRIEFVRSNIRTSRITRSDYHISTDRYAIKMIPVRIVEDLGYVAVWDSVERVVTISLNGQVIIVLHPGDNNYQRNGVLQRSLEMAPILKNNSMYVPISFFDQILSLTSFRVDAQGNINFITYLY